MQRKIILLLLNIWPVLLSAQVTISVQLPPAGIVGKDHLWNLILVNNKDGIIDVSIKMKLQEITSGQVLLSANTGTLVLGKGVKIITARDIQPIAYNYNTSGFSGNYLPIGSYIICYQVYQRVHEGDQPLGDECIKVTIDPLSPPLLNSPADKSEIQTPYPQLTWIPPTPFDMFNNLTYDVLIAEILSGQTAAEAIQYNSPVYSKSNIIQPYDNYPTSFTKLDTGKNYAWQVTARNGSSYAVKTEIWIFKIKPDGRPTIIPENESYILLGDDMTGAYMVKKDVLHFRYFSSDNEHIGKIIFSDSKGKSITVIDQKIVQGDNYFDLDVRQICKPGKLYKVAIADMAGKSHSLTFSINKN